MLREETFPTEEGGRNAAVGPPSGPPLVLLHGVTRRWQSFLPLMPALALRWQVFALDFRGHGRSERAAGRYFVADYVRDAVAFVRHRVGRRAVVYGHSLGAMVAAATAAELPDLVQAVVLEDPPFDTMGNRIGQSRLLSQFAGMQHLAGSPLDVAQLARAAADIRVTDPQTNETVQLGETRDAVALRFTAACLKRLDPDVLAPIVAGRWLEGYDRDEILRRICCPALLLQADYAAGGMLTDGDASQVESLIADCTRIRLPQTAHLIHWQKTAETINLVSGFLGSLD